MIKVLMFNKLYHPSMGGVERLVYDLCEEIKGKVELKVLAANTKFKTEIEQRDKYQVTRAASLGCVMSSVHLGIGIPWWWTRLESDIIHFHFPSPVAELYCLALSPKEKPIVVTYHSDIIGHKLAMFFYRPFLINFIKRATRIVTTSPEMIENSPFLSKVKDKCRVIPYGIQMDKFKLTAEVKARSEAIKGKFKSPIILFVGRLVKYKGVDYLIEAMRDINATLLIIGEGPEEKRLKELIGEIGIEEGRIFFIGKVEDKELLAYYYASHVFVLPSISNNEAFGIVQLEAQACGRPVVSTALPTGVPFVNLNGETGIVVPPKSSEKLAEAINRLLEDGTLRLRLGEQAKKRVESQFTREIMAQKTLELYKELMSLKKEV
ncbi:MAG: mannosyltransferase [Candidatus Omnitrophica bacterium CG07_land_8_20_14_0_80_42_15]|uniref:Mannosyltransferase n=1 Tax=Candidatus Aquitaenariimonas noxiae TaxID=1974741 RepID=A0A2J0KUC7_9BACT|nr:MAG: mannosyltransferase [Candidatus Omnitrophica bacterium CG07_land_8_20_14_0_80_42_15]